MRHRLSRSTPGVRPRDELRRESQSALWYAGNMMFGVPVLQRFLALTGVIVLVTHVCVLPVAGLAWTAQGSPEHRGGAQHQDDHDGGCEMLRTHVVEASPVAIRASEALDASVRHVAGIVYEQAAGLGSRPPRFLLHAALRL
jgi:hypothetical protein